jgi:hypothetical protein
MSEIEVEMTIEQLLEEFWANLLRKFPLSFFISMYQKVNRRENS